MPSNVVDQAKLVLNAFAAIFENNLVTKDVVTWKQYDTEMNDRNGLTVVEQVGPSYQITRTTNGVQDLTSGVQDSVFGSEQFKVQDVFGSSMGWGDFVKIRDIGDARESEAIKNAAIRLAERIDGYVLGVAATASSWWKGTPGNSVASYNDVAAGYTQLKEEGVEDSDLRAVLTYGDKQALAGYIVNNNASMQDLSKGIYREGFDGTVAGIPTLFTQQLPTITTGTRTNGTNGGANQNVHYRAVSVSPAPGQYLTQTLNIAGLGANATIKDGEVFTLAGVNAYDPRLGASLGYLRQFRVIGDTTADGTGAATVRIFPAIIVPAAGATGDNAVDSAFATVDAVPAAAAALTWVAGPNVSVKPRVILQKQAVIVNTADLIMPATGIGMRKSLTEVPLSIRMWKNSNFNTGEHDVRFDVAVTANIRERRRAVRINGA